MTHTVKVDYPSAMLEKMGMRDDEAKIYSLAVSLGSCTVGEISRYIGFSRAKIYNVFDKLMAGGWVKVISDKPKRFIPIDPKKVLSDKKEDMVFAYENAMKHLVPVYEKTKLNVSDIVVNRGYETVRDVTDMLKRAKNEVAIITSFLPSEIMDGMLEIMMTAKKRGVRIKILVSDKLSSMEGIKKLKENFEVRTGAIPNAGFLIIDRKEVLIGSADIDGSIIDASNISGIWTRDRQLVKFLVMIFDQFCTNVKTS